MDGNKAEVTLDGVPLAGKQGIAWQFVSGVTPYTTTLSVHKDQWDKLKGKAFKIPEKPGQTASGDSLELKVKDSRGTTISVQGIYILYEAPSDSPNRVAFVVADQRWIWSYRLVCRDFNIPRKTGDKSILTDVPVETRVSVDRYDYLSYSVKEDGTKWKAREALEEILKLIVGDDGYEVESFPLQDEENGTGQFTLQNVTLRDPADVAIARLLQNIPGADIYIRADGKVAVYDTTAIGDLEDYRGQLPNSTWDGDKVRFIDRKQTRPRVVRVHYQRELEVLFSFSDDYAGSTSSAPSRTAPYIENVLPTVDPETEITEFDPEEGTDVTKRVPPGTWVRFDAWLAAMDADRPEGSLPWTFDTIKKHWVAGDLEGVLGARGLDFDETANVAMRVATLRQHFRQTFRINRRIMERCRDLFSLRVAVLDPVTGARAPSAVWGQACVIPSTKGKFIAARGGGETKVFRNVDYLAPADTAGTSVVNTAPGPTKVAILDRDLGIFRLEWIASPYGTVDSFIPCKLVDDAGSPAVVDRDLALQDTKPMAVNATSSVGTNGLFLANRMQYKVLLTIVPNSPNNEKQFHRVVVDPDSIKEMFRSDIVLTGGYGPPLDVFVTPGEYTARFAWIDDTDAYDTVQRLLGLDQDGTGGGIPFDEELPGFQLANGGAQKERHLEAHAQSVAAELLASYSDNPQGNLVTRPPETVKLVGNTSSITLRIAEAPSGKVQVMHQFPGQMRPVSRFALLPESTRAQVLGTLPFKD